MENLLTRYRNVSILVTVLFLQVLGLAMQVKRNKENESSRLIRVWAVSAITPLEKTIVWMQTGSSRAWHNYLYLRGVREENRQLREEIEQLRVGESRMREDAEQGHRLQVLLAFKQQFIAKTMAAQVIGASGSEQSRLVYIDKGWRDGVRPDMAVITADGVVGKVLQAFGAQPLEASASQVLLINDQTSGVGVVLGRSRQQGILRGTAMGGVVLEKVMSDEQVLPGDQVLTSGGDQIFPKGLTVGTVMEVSRGKESLNIRVKPAADLGRLEEVLVITQEETKLPEVTETGTTRAADVLALRFPSVPDQPARPQDTGKPAQSTAESATQPATTTGGLPASAAKPTANPVSQSETAERQIPSPNKATMGSAGTQTKQLGKVAPTAKPTESKVRLAGGPSPAKPPAGATGVKPANVATGSQAQVKTSNGARKPAAGATVKPTRAPVGSEASVKAPNRASKAAPAPAKTATQPAALQPDQSRDKPQ
jgi:rod shape-determining protein MreC